MSYSQDLPTVELTVSPDFEFFGAESALHTTVTPVLDGTRAIRRGDWWGNVITGTRPIFSGYQRSFTLPAVGGSGWESKEGEPHGAWTYDVEIYVSAPDRAPVLWSGSIAPTGATADITPADGTVVSEVAVGAPTGVNSTKGGLSLGSGTSTNLVAELPTPFYVAHRGGPSSAPENSLEAFRINDATGVHVLEADFQPTGDGALVAMHDSTVDRTTDGTGPVSGYTLQSLQTLDAAAHTPWPAKATIPTLQQLISEFGHSRVLQIESKNISQLDSMLDAAEAAGIKGNIMVETSTFSVAREAASRGYVVWFFWGNTITSPTLQEVVDAGVQHLAAASGVYGGGVSDATVSEMVATGLPVTIYNVHRRYDRDRFLALGVAGISSDNPTYVARDTAMTKKDSWRYGVWGHGLSTNRGTQPPVEDGALILETTGSGVYEIAVPGEVLPITQSSYTIDVDLGWRTLPTDLTRALQVQFCIADDRTYNYSTKTQTYGYPNAYQLHLRANGSLELYHMKALKDGVEPSSTRIGSAVTTAALVAGEFARVQIKVSPTEVSIQRTDTASPVISYANTEFRGGYINLTRFADNGVGMFRDLTIS